MVIALGGIAVHAAKEKPAPAPQPTAVYDPYCDGWFYYINGLCWLQ
jgi:hypothetical protein